MERVFRYSEISLGREDFGYVGVGTGWLDFWSLLEGEWRVSRSGARGIKLERTSVERDVASRL